MRFKRSDVPGMLIAVLGPVALMFLLLESYQLWDHHGTPILGILSANLAIVGGLVGGFWRFVRARDVVIGLALALALSVIGVLILQQVGEDGTAAATLLKVVAVMLFLALNVVVVQQFLVHGLNPILVRREERRAALLEEQA
ncbi:MAG: hypothetical protein M0R73_05525 [Dehalococcoidia bacterium]|nr:hypothetical protein [Dehalococcoidia bacterium]